MSCRIGRLFVIVAVMVASTSTARGQQACCMHCGSTSTMQPVCRPVCVTRPMKETTWDVVEEHVCTSGVCTDACKLRPRNRLMRKTHLKEVPTIIWTVEYVCGNCGGGGGRDFAAGHAQASDLSPCFSTSESSVSQWSGPSVHGGGTAGRATGPGHPPQSSPLDGLIRAVRGYVGEQ